MSLRTDRSVFDMWDNLPEEFKQITSLIKRGESSYCWTLKNKHQSSTKDPLSNVVNIDEIFEILYTLKRLFELYLIKVDVGSFSIKPKKRFEI